MDVPISASESKPPRCRWRKWILITAILALIASPLILCWWVLWWPNFSIRTTLHLYPDVQQVSESYSYFGADRGLKSLYYWTPDSVNRVQDYYEDFIGTPFIIDRWNETLIQIYHPYGGELTAWNFDATRLERDLSVERRCHYSEPYRCVNIQLLAIDDPLQDLLLFSSVGASNSMNATPHLTAPLSSGTVIIYSYYVSDF